VVDEKSPPLFQITTKQGVKKMSQTILIVEDESAIAQKVRLYFE